MKIGLIGWRGMVGSVLLQRLHEEGDLERLAISLFSTSATGTTVTVHGSAYDLLDAYDLAILSSFDLLISTQGSDYTKAVYQDLRDRGWTGFWIDASSELRLAADVGLVLDPVNLEHLEDQIDAGIRTFSGTNCSVSLMLMALGGLYEADLVEWISSMTYQAASGAGAAQMRELMFQMKAIVDALPEDMNEADPSVLEIDQLVTQTLRSGDFPITSIGHPLAGSALPWIDSEIPQTGQSKEEWKGGVETNKVLNRPERPVPVDGLCIRIGSMRCHAQAFTIKLKRDASVSEVERLLAEHNPWVKIVPNTKNDTLRQLTPSAVAGTLSIPVGRIRKLSAGPEYLTAYTVGDQLLWGAAEPLRRMIGIIETRAFSS